MSFLNFIGGVANTISTSVQNKKNREFQAEQNELDRVFNAEQAEIQRDWQEEIYQKYESPAAQAQQRKQAGLSPLEGIQSQNVGTGSTAHSNSSGLPPGQPLDFSFISQLEMFKADLESKRLDNEIKEEDVKQEKVATWLAEFDQGNREEIYKRELAKLDNEIAKGGAEAESARISRDALQLAYDQSKEAADSGINPVVDEHMLKVSQTALNSALRSLNVEQRNKLKSEIKLISQQIRSQELGNAIKQIEAYWHQQFGFDLLNTDLSYRKSVKLTEDQKREMEIFKIILDIWGKQIQEQSVDDDYNLRNAENLRKWKELENTFEYFLISTSKEISNWLREGLGLDPYFQD